MAETGSSAGGSWWNNWIQTAKEKSVEALDFVKRDLSEFTTTVQSDGKKVLTNVKENLNQDNVNAATQKAKEGVNSFLGGITKVLTVEPEDKCKPPTSKSKSQPIFDRAKARLNAIQIDEGTYTNEPAGSKEEFVAWLETFNLDNKKGEISELLVANVEVRSLYTQLVPSMVSHADFWQRYFYKLHELHQDEARREALKKRAEDSTANLAWDDSDDDTDDWVDMSGPSSPPSDSHILMHKQHSQVSNIAVHQTAVNSTNSSDLNNVEVVKAKSCDEQVAVVTDTVMDRGSDSADSQTQDNSAESPTLKDEHDSHSRASVLAEETTSEVSNTSNTGVAEGIETLSLESSTDTLTASSAAEARTSAVPTVKEPHESEGSSESLVLVNAEKNGDSVVKTREKGDLVVVGSGASSDRTTLSSNSSNKELDDDWEAEFDIDVTEEDIKLAQETLKLTADTDNPDDEWESWD